MWLVTRWLYRMSRVVEMKPQPWHTPFSESVWTFKCRSQFALVVKADRQIKHTNGRSPEIHSHTQTKWLFTNQTLEEHFIKTNERVLDEGKGETRLTAVSSHMDLQRAGAGAAFVALWEGTHPFVGVWVFRLVLWRRGSGLLLLPARAVVHEMSLEISLTSVPDSTVFAWKNILCEHIKYNQLEQKQQANLSRLKEFFKGGYNCIWRTEWEIKSLLSKLISLTYFLSLSLSDMLFILHVFYHRWDDVWCFIMQPLHIFPHTKQFKHKHSLIHNYKSGKPIIARATGTTGLWEHAHVPWYQDDYTHMLNTLHLITDEKSQLSLSTITAQLMQQADHVLPFNLIYSDYSCVHHDMTPHTDPLK